MENGRLSMKSDRRAVRGWAPADVLQPRAGPARDPAGAGRARWLRHREKHHHPSPSIAAQPCTATGMFCKDERPSRSYRPFISVLLWRVMV